MKQAVDHCLILGKVSHVIELNQKAWLRPRQKLSYADTDNFIFCAKSEEICEDLPEDVETKFETSICKVERSYPWEKTKKERD